jgi:DNA-binding Lrp family transcriptional regulator
MAKTNKDQITQDEKKIITELEKNSQESIDTIAKHCGFSRQKVWRAMKDMEANHVIWGYTAVSDEQKQGLQKYVLLMKKSTQKIDDKTAEQLILYRTNKDIQNLGITIENSYFAHGEYDWILIFTAQDIVRAKKFSQILLNNYPGMISKINLIQLLMTLRSQHILNPDYLKLKEFL